MKFYRRICTVWLIAGLLLSNVSAKSPALQSGQSRPLDPAYLNAVLDAMVPEPAEIANDLMIVSRDNKELVWNSEGRILVVAWKSQGDFDLYYKNEKATGRDADHVTWVTIAPEIQKFCQDYLRTSRDPSGLELRLKQYLGLNPERRYDVFVRMWVRPSDLFRPCSNPAIAQSACEVALPPGRPPKVRHIKDYGAFFRNLYYGSFRTSPGVPWTGLGYTYDWGNPGKERGASEFILVPEAKYTILENPVPSLQYCSAN